MKKFTLAMLFGLCLVSVGCADKAAVSNVAENADAKKIADYEAEMAAQQKASDDAEKGAGN